MGLPPRAYYSLFEAAARWDCSLSDIAGWASVGRFDIVSGIGPALCGEALLAGFVTVSVSDILPMFRRGGTGSSHGHLRRIRGVDAEDWSVVTEPAGGLAITLEDLVIMADQVRRFEEECSLLQRPAVHVGSTAKYDWDGMYRALIRRVHDQGVPSTQAAWVGEMQEWFIARSKSGEVPDERTIRRRLNPIWKALRDPC
ncbi:hypothetical protein A9Q96_04920 [Rhodobacterales bacterium 52_120_T64]|nr:hypothetical protein A9Q96_04920 [Rhodobacterales bacterium 52_120_T64]